MGGIPPPQTLKTGVYISPPLCTDHLALCAHKMCVHNIVDHRSFIYLHMFVHSPCIHLACNHDRRWNGERWKMRRDQQQQPPQHWEPLLWAPAHGVGTGATSKQWDNGNTATRPNTMTGLWETTKQQDNWRWGGNNKETKQMKKGPWDVVWHLLGCW